MRYDTGQASPCPCDVRHKLVLSTLYVVGADILVHPRTPDTPKRRFGHGVSSCDDAGCDFNHKRLEITFHSQGSATPYGCTRNGLTRPEVPLRRLDAFRTLPSASRIGDDRRNEADPDHVGQVRSERPGFAKPP